ncbi:Lrp/AsnC family transcriptional regulator [Pontixanthobacter aestiaquae]|uniref:AsnC family transcriptional regulator n=1 Tax=Pontixanthobacter aestiaquae TaxID=1509367 RepID=A0A844Z528_9SPHN|nr:Lrp/AsnC family transcriptional regulator [Pontixanthobacter aestiaquae]MDN3646640.1 Lrp/AsnC family transcriptional regulator [Pontixanthobacter aestiaquae]MXO82376.1 AsnC family transcriptional regulator [Pontixanthobacter aestiaquae]
MTDKKEQRMGRAELDAKDVALLRSLERNARASLVSLARDIDLSRSATHDRIARLEEIGAIEGYTIRLGREAKRAARAFFSLGFVSGPAQTELAPKISEMKGVRAAHCLSGDIDMLVYCECETNDELGALRNELANLAGVSTIVTRPILSTSTA